MDVDKETNLICIKRKRETETKSRKRKRTGSALKGKAKRRKAKHRKRNVRALKLVNEQVRAIVPYDLTELTIYGLRHYYWQAFLKRFHSLSQEEADWFNFPSNPHLNTLKFMTEDLIAQSKGEPPIARQTASASGNEDEIELDFNDDEISLDLMEEEEVEPAENSVDDVPMKRKAMEPIDLRQSLLAAKEALPTPDLKKVKDIFAHFAETEKKQTTTPKLVWGPMSYEWLLPHPHRHIYVPYRWARSPKKHFSKNFRKCLTLFQNSCNATREIARLEVAKGKVSVYMAEHTKEELQNLQEGCPPGVPIKFWAQRYRLWQKFDEGVQMVGTESWFSVTPQWIAQHIAWRCTGASTIVDAFCGAGGNSVCFAKICDEVLAIDINPEAVSACEHNSQIYSVHNKLKFQTGDFFEVLPNLQGAEVIFLGPPWGGDSYSKGMYDVENMGSGINLFEVVQKVHEQLPNASVAICLPKNCDYIQLAKLRELFGNTHFEIEQHLIYGKCKMWTVYCGNAFAKKPSTDMWTVFSDFQKGAKCTSGIQQAVE